MNTSDRTCGERLSSTLVLAVLLCHALLMTSLGMTQEPLIVPPQNLPPVLTGPYKISVGNVLAINFYKTTEFSQTGTVGLDGAISLPLTGRIVVVGRTVEDVTADVNGGLWP